MKEVREGWKWETEVRDLDRWEVDKESLDLYYKRDLFNNKSLFLMRPSGSQSEGQSPWCHYIQSLVAQMSVPNKSAGLQIWAVFHLHLHGFF